MNKYIAIFSPIEYEWSKNEFCPILDDECQVCRIKNDPHNYHLFLDCDGIIGNNPECPLIKINISKED